MTKYSKERKAVSVAILPKARSPRALLLQYEFPAPYLLGSASRLCIYFRRKNALLAIHYSGSNYISWHTRRAEAKYTHSCLVCICEAALLRTNLFRCVSLARKQPWADICIRSSARARARVPVCSKCMCVQILYRQRPPFLVSLLLWFMITSTMAEKCPLRSFVKHEHMTLTTGRFFIQILSWISANIAR